MNASGQSEDDLLWPMLLLAAPVLVERSLDTLVGYTDMWLTGRFFEGPQYITAVNLAGYMMWLIYSLFATLSIGSTALTARFSGAGDLPLAARVLHQALMLGLVLSGVVAVALWFGAEGLVAIMQLEGESASLAARYLRILAPVIPALMFEQIAIACLQGVGDTMAGFIARSLVVVVNMAVSAALVIGFGPIPSLGFEGLAIGTACGHLVGAATLLTMLVAGRSGLTLRWSELTLEPDLIARLLRIGLPGGVDVLTILVCHLAYLAIINRQGDASAAAHGLGITIESLAYMPASAFQVAASTLTGQHLGAGRPDRASRAALLACAAGMLFMTFAGVLLFFGGRSLADFFTGPRASDTAAITAQLLQIVALAMPSLAVTMILTGALRGAGDTTSTLVITLIGFVGVRLPGALLLANAEVPIPLLGIVLPGAGLAVHGAWWAMVADILLRSILTALRFWQGEWQKVTV